VNRGGTQPLAEYRTIEEIDEAYSANHCKNWLNMLKISSTAGPPFGVLIPFYNLWIKWETYENNTDED
jgi:hypothetical protein